MSQLLNDLRAAIRVRHYSIRTEQTYAEWKELEDLGDIVRAKRPKKLPPTVRAFTRVSRPVSSFTRGFPASRLIPRWHPINGSLLFDRGEEFIVSGDASARASAASSGFFLPDIREACPFEVTWVSSPSMFARRLAEDKTPTFTLPVFKKGNRKTMRELNVIAVPGRTLFWRQIKPGVLPAPGNLCHLWPIVQWDGEGFTFWGGSEWQQFKWDANIPLHRTRVDASR